MPKRINPSFGSMFWNGVSVWFKTLLLIITISPMIIAAGGCEQGKQLTAEEQQQIRNDYEEATAYADSQIKKGVCEKFEKSLSVISENIPESALDIEVAKTYKFLEDCELHMKRLTLSAENNEHSPKWKETLKKEIKTYKKRLHDVRRKMTDAYPPKK